MNSWGRDTRVESGGTVGHRPRRESRRGRVEKGTATPDHVHVRQGSDWRVRPRLGSDGDSGPDPEPTHPDEV